MLRKKEDVQFRNPIAPLRALIVEDNKRDLKLMVATLEQAGYIVQYAAVDAPALLQKVLEEGSYEVIISDFNLQSWTAIDALAIVKESGKDIPFIVVTGSLGDEAAVECIKHGATDFVLKDRMARLPVAVENALKEKQSRDEHRRVEMENIRLRTAIEQFAEAIVITDAAGIIQYVNPAFTWMTGYASEEALNQNTRMLKSGVQSEEVYRDLWQTIQAGKTWQGEIINRRKDGTLYPEWMTIAPVQDAAGAVVNYIAIKEDITERKHAAQKLMASEVRYRRLFETAKDGILILDAETRVIIDVNPYLEDLLGYSRQEFLGKQLWEIGLFKDKQNSQESVRLLQENEFIRYDDLPLEAKGGKQVDVEFVSNVYWAGEKKVIQCNIRDITKRKREAEKLRQSEELFRLISENVTDLIAVVDLDGRRVYNSPSYGGIIGSPDALRGTVSFNEIHPDDRENIKAVFRETIRSGIGQRAEYRFLLADNTTRLIESQGSLIRNQHGEPVNVLIVSRDITERKSLEDQFRQAQKMEAVGQLAGGVAHDFNNLLTVINGYSEIMLQRLTPDAPEYRYADEIKKAGDRAAKLTRQLLAFSRQQVLASQVLDLNHVIANVQGMLKRLIGEDVELIAVPGKELGRVKADPGQVEQILLNLVVNARDAIPHGGKVIIETANVELDEAYARKHQGTVSGPHVMLAVSDTGAGMDAQTQKHIFEPFFTTKEKGKGTGLGLSTVYGIVKQSGGNIWLYSEPGCGTTFKIYFPRVDQPVEVAGPLKAKSAPARGTETILMVEDEPSVRLLVRSTLESAGYQMLEATNGIEAMSIAEKQLGKIHLLLTDLVMPGMNGRELAERMTTLHPEARTLLMSGYTDDVVIRHGGLGAGMDFLQKPFTPDALARKVRAVLDAASNAIAA